MIKYIIFVFVAALIIVAIMWPSGNSPSKQSGMPSNGNLAPGNSALPNVTKSTPFATRDDFYNEWQKYISGGVADQGKIKETAAQHGDWLDLIFPEKYSDFHDGIRLIAGHYRILYPYVSTRIIDEYKILNDEVQANNLKNVSELIDRGANANTYYTIISAHSVEMIDLLVKKGVNPNQPADGGAMPLDFFKKLGRPDLIQAMIRNGARGRD